ncbi:undecaprenyl-diphosphatase [Variovorax ginsengisoli]|uniref:Undecaprenyl-diphosphatase n=2 Tax=Variovorax ginsengisoli TaxID=363844 RepID=A0ABT9SFE3_9BURK|nr:undecaprenyl-diphosphatase [Variovorax ginsengisoli]
MSDLNTTLFNLVAAGFEPHPILLVLAVALASGGVWVGVAIVIRAWWRPAGMRVHIVWTLAVAALAAMAAHAIAAALNLPRPFMLGLSPEYISHGARGSLPSTHATVMSAIALMFLLRRPLRPAGIAMALVAGITGWARVYVGVHFPVDIAAGIILAAGITGLFFASAVVLRRLRASQSARRSAAILRTP